MNLPALKRNHDRETDPPTTAQTNRLTNQPTSGRANWEASLPVRRRTASFRKVRREKEKDSKKSTQRDSREIKIFTEKEQSGICYDRHALVLNYFHIEGISITELLSCLWVRLFFFTHRDFSGTRPRDEVESEIDKILQLPPCGNN